MAVTIRPALLPGSPLNIYLAQVENVVKVRNMIFDMSFDILKSIVAEGNIMQGPK
jgi:hypothetical protein